MNEHEFQELDAGDVVRHVHGSRGYIVTGNYLDRKIITRTQLISEPKEWLLVRKANPEKELEHE